MAEHDDLSAAGYVMPCRPATEHLPLLFRDRTGEGAAAKARQWAKDEGLTVRTLARIVRRDDLPTWGAEDDPYVTEWAWEVTLAVASVPEGIELPTLPEAPTLPLWAGVA